MLDLPAMHFTDKVEGLRSADFHIVTVPIDASKQPNLDPLQPASAMIGSILKKGDIVVYESTVYPGVTEDVCIPVQEESQASNGRRASMSGTRQSASILGTGNNAFIVS
jgi:UDP-N-acetyl-D-glucosamine/UDP-N-acetyl-D-galactosamine dehydrogenase